MELEKDDHLTRNELDAHDHCNQGDQCEDLGFN